MKEYITKDRAKQFVCGHCNEVCSEEPCEPSDCDWMAFIDKEPAADVVEVVRCKDCVSSRPINKEYWVENAFYEECVWCQWFDTGMLPDEYCSYGKRKMDKEE